MNKGHEKFVQELLNQMPQLSSERYTSYRRQLAEKLASVRREEKAMRWIVLAAWIGTTLICCGGIVFSLRHSDFHQKVLPDWFSLILAASILLLPVGTLLLLGLYLFKYRRRVTRSQAALHEAALEELQRQINEMRAELLPAQDDGSKQRPSL